MKPVKENLPIADELLRRELMEYAKRINQLIIANSSRARVTKDDAQAIPNALYTIVEYDDVDWDSLGEWDATTWRFTAKYAGYYSVKAGILMADTAWAAGNHFYLAIHKNAGIQTNNLHEIEANITKFMGLIVTGDVYLNGTTDYIDIRIYQNSGGAVNTNNSADWNFVAIHRSS